MTGKLRGALPLLRQWHPHRSTVFAGHVTEQRASLLASACCRCNRDSMFFSSLLGEGHARSCSRMLAGPRAAHDNFTRGDATSITTLAGQSAGYHGESSPRCSATSPTALQTASRRPRPPRSCNRRSRADEHLLRAAWSRWRSLVSARCGQKPDLPNCCASDFL